MLTRRALLMGVAVAPLAGCSVNWSQVQAGWNNFVDQVTALVATGCGIAQGFIPTVATIASAAAALFGTGAEQFVAGIAGAVNQVATALCAAMQQPKPAGFAARFAASTPVTPTVIGNIVVNGQVVQVIGYHARFGTARRSYVPPAALQNRAIREFEERGGQITR